jgi:hypothetical protein
MTGSRSRTRGPSRCSTEQCRSCSPRTGGRVEVDEDGLGPTFYLPLAWDGESRFLLSASGFYAEDGVDVEVSKSEDATVARGDRLAELGLDREAFLAISEEGVWFARWDQASAGERPATAAPRDAKS